MELIKVQLARAIWLFDTQELNPRGLSLFPNVYLAFSKRYHFAIAPKPEEFHSATSLYFKQGNFTYDELSNVDVDFELHADGLVANSRHSTEASNAFLQDCLNWLGERLAVKYPSALTHKRVYRSELMVHMNPRLDLLVDRLQDLRSVLSEITKQPIHPTGIYLGSEERPALFQVDRRQNTPFEANQYFSGAALQTYQHLETLELFEKLLIESPARPT